MNREGLATRTWFFDLDDTLHDASHAAFPYTAAAMSAYVEEHLGLPAADASALRQHYWNRYGATLLGLVRHHGVRAGHFLEQTHQLPGLEQRLRGHAPDRAALRRLPGRKFVLTNAPRDYALRVLNTLRLTDCFEGVISIEDMTMFGQHRPKPDARMFRHVLAKLKLQPARCVLVEDTLAHQRAARRVGLRTVWMQRYLRPLHAPGTAGVHRCQRPACVNARVGSVGALARLWAPARVTRG